MFVKKPTMRVNPIMEFQKDDEAKNASKSKMSLFSIMRLVTYIKVWGYCRASVTMVDTIDHVVCPLNLFVSNFRFHLTVLDAL